jgi:hypothetical protein
LRRRLRHTAKHAYQSNAHTKTENQKKNNPTTNLARCAGCGGGDDTDCDNNNSLHKLDTPHAYTHARTDERLFVSLLLALEPRLNTLPRSLGVALYVLTGVTGCRGGNNATGGVFSGGGGGENEL